MNTMPPAVISRCLGELERCTSAEIRGWAIEDGRPAVVNIFAGGSLLKTLTCDRPRPDLEVAGVPPNAGFQFKIPPQSIMLANILVSVQFADGAELVNSPQPFLRYDGQLEHGDERGLKGWASWDGGPAELEVYVGGNLVGTVQTNVRRDDVEGSLHLGYDAGFQYAFPGLLSDVSVSVRFRDGTVLGEYNAPPLRAIKSREYQDALERYRAQVERALIETNKALRHSDDSPAEPARATLLRATREILESGLFDSELYLQDNPDVRASGMEPLDHYLRYGEAEDRRPNLVFRPSEYIRLNHLRLSEQSYVLAHYSSYGERHGLRPSLAFDPKAYLDANPPLQEIVGRPLFHYLKIGRAADLPLQKRSKAGSSGHKPRIVAQLAVKNEAGLIERTISHLRNIGVDHIVACDIASTDGTREILERHRSSDFWVEFVSDAFNGENPSASEVASFQRYRDAGADWVIFLDADEFWIPASGNLKDCEALADVDVLSVPRFNVVPGPAGPLMPDLLDPARYDELLVIARPLADIHAWLTQHPDTPWIMGLEAPKIMARTNTLVGVTVGEHEAVVQTGAPICRARASDVFIAHLPVTNRDRFRQKVKSIVALQEVLGVSDPAWAENVWKKGGVAWHWWRWATLARRHAVDEEFDRNIFSQAQIEALREKGVIRSAAQILAEHLIEPARIYCTAKK